MKGFSLECGGGGVEDRGKRKSSPKPYISLHTESCCLTEPRALKKVPGGVVSGV